MENKYHEVMECIRDIDKSIRVSEKYLQEEPELLYILDIVHKNENRPRCKMMSEAVIQRSRKL